MPCWRSTNHQLNIPHGILFAISFVSSGGGLLFGYDMGIISGAIPHLHEVFKLNCTQQELVVSFLLLGALISSLLGGYFIDLFGRKFSIIVSSVLFVVGALVLAFSYNFTTLLFGRVLVGFAMALSASSECVYVSEVSPASIRGRMVSLNELGITLGILLSYLIGLVFAKNPNGWRYMFGISSFGGIGVLICMFFLPQSPRYLLMKKKLVEARKALKKLRKKDFPEKVNREFEEIQKHTSNEGHFCISFQHCNNKLVFPIVIGSGLIVFQQTTGEPNILFYASTILLQMGFDGEVAAGVASMALGLTKVVATVACLLLVDRWGRKFFLTIGCISITISVLAISILSHVNDIQGHNTCIMSANSTGDTKNTSTLPTIQSAPEVKWISLVLLMAVIAAYSCSFGPITWIILSEIFPTHLRGRLFSLVTSLNWTINLIISATFLEFAKAGLGLAMPFGLNALFGFLAILFIYFCVPETKGLSLEEVQSSLGKGLSYFVKRKCCFNSREEPLTPLIALES